MQDSRYALLHGQTRGDPGAESQRVLLSIRDTSPGGEQDGRVACSRNLQKKRKPWAIMG